MVSIEALLEQLHDYAQDIRNDWSEFDGRSLLRYTDRWIERMRTAISRSELFGEE